MTTVQFKVGHPIAVGGHVANPGEPEGIGGERTNMDSPVIPSNAGHNNREEMEGVNGFHSDSSVNRLKVGLYPHPWRLSSRLPVSSLRRRLTVCKIPQSPHLAVVSLDAYKAPATGKCNLLGSDIPDFLDCLAVSHFLGML